MDHQSPTIFLLHEMKVKLSLFVGPEYLKHAPIYPIFLN